MGDGTLADATQVIAAAAPQIRELHIDFLLEEEFSADPEFLSRFISAAGRCAKRTQFGSVRRSVADAFGEADLVVVYRDFVGKHVAILIEDKLRAGLQPDQPERYRQRGLHGVGQNWDEFWTCLVAPKSYIQRGHAFDHAVPLESVIEMFGRPGDRRGAFKRQVLVDAIRKCESNGVQVVDPIMTKFREDHFAWFQDFFRDELFRNQIRNIRPPAPIYEGDTWFEVRSPLLPKGSYIVHKSSMGAVDLAFADTGVASLEQLQPYLESGMVPVQTNKSASIRINVPAITSFRNFTTEEPKIIEAGRAIRRLLAFFLRERPRFEVTSDAVATV